MIPLLFVSLFPLPSFAQLPAPLSPATGEGCADVSLASADALTVAEANALLSGLGVEVKEVKESPIRGMWELVMEKSGERSIAYLDHEKKHLMPGPIFEIATKSLVGDQAARPPQPAKVDISSIPLADSIVMGNPKAKKRLFVFTDPDCPFCARLHWELVKLSNLEPDLAIYVKMFPLKMHPQAFEKTRVILGARSLKLLETAFLGQALPAPGPNDPAKPVEETITLGARLGVTATPTLVLPDGRLVPGVKSVAELKRLIDW